MIQGKIIALGNTTTKFGKQKQMIMVDIDGKLTQTWVNPSMAIVGATIMADEHKEGEESETGNTYKSDGIHNVMLASSAEELKAEAKIKAQLKYGILSVTSVEEE